MRIEQVDFIENEGDVGIQCMHTCVINLPEGGVRIVGFTTPTTHYPVIATYMCGASKKVACAQIYLLMCSGDVAIA